MVTVVPAWVVTIKHCPAGVVRRKRSRRGQHTLSQRLAKARQYVTSGSLGLAVEAYKQLILDHPDCEACYFELAGVYWRQGLLREAESAYRSALKLNPGNAGAYCNLGVIVWKRTACAMRFPIFIKPSVLNPRYAAAMYNLAGMLLQEGDCRGGNCLVRKILEIEPQQADAWMYKGNAHFEMGEYEYAMACYSRHVELKPSGGAQIRLAAAIPMIPESAEHITAMRALFMNRLQDLIDAGITVKDPVRENGYTNFFLCLSWPK